MKQIVFYLGLGMLFTHELDAMPNHEWRILPLLGATPDNIGFQIFLLAHVPIFAVAIALVASLNASIRTRTRVVVSAFLLAHGLLHALFGTHPLYEFSSFSSEVLIYGSAIFGSAYLVMEGRERYGRAAQL
jgi:heme/copper-type cytochrome/quinol oxidase subunit 3